MQLLLRKINNMDKSLSELICDVWEPIWKYIKIVTIGTLLTIMMIIGLYGAYDLAGIWGIIFTLALYFMLFACICYAWDNKQYEYHGEGIGESNGL